MDEKSTALCLLPQRMSNQNQCRHRFHHRHRPWQYTGIMPPARLKPGVFVTNIHGVLLVHHRRHRLECDAEENGLSVGMPPWMPPEKFVVVNTFYFFARNASLCSRPVIKILLKPEPISNAFDAGNSTSLSPNPRQACSNTGSPQPAGTRAQCLRQRRRRCRPPGECRQSIESFPSPLSGRETDDVRFHVFEPDFVGSIAAMNSLDLFDVSQRFHAELFPQNFLAMAPAATRPIVSRALARPRPANCGCHIWPSR